ncbi:type II toxin-antitoxin system HicB family antitoxin [Novispirillum itersonii]|uniref:Putative RNase H-like HicB family nuclease n=1 Tax=Novispirillum itersonii TaxID=189 RepID=A0A7W9ZKB0_NOVIT|nr:type II toxin-antitoxin system HicB family antitoxin [Novispirillum itersonii]MBB6212518.1 putative RNase H-like HicB family nuclease [Novispirillum itersonii]
MFKTYAAVIETGPDSEAGCSAFFPDLPGCAAAGDTVAACFEDAHGALALHLAGMIEDGDPLPDPTPLDQITVDDDVHVAHIALIRVPVTGKTQRINITIDSTLLAAIDDVTTNRSAWLADAALAALRGQAR